MKILSIIFLWGLTFLGCFHNIDEYEQILAIEDQRGDCNLLLPFLKKPEPKIRRRALEAMARLQDTTCVFPIVKLLDDLNHNVRIEAAFALGQIGGQSAEDGLLKKFKNKDMVEVKCRVLEALGKIGSANSFSAIATSFTDIHHESRAEAALSLGRMAFRGLTDSSTTVLVTELLRDSHAEVRWKAAYALMRIGKDFDPEPLIAVIEDSHALVRMYAIMALGSLEDFRFVEPIGEALSRDPDWRVRVKAANVFAKYPLQLSANHLTLFNQPQQVRVAIIEAIGQSALLEKKKYRANSRELNYVKTQLEQVLVDVHNEHFSQAERGAAMIAYARLMQDEAFDLIVSLSHEGSGRIQARAMQALGEIGSPEVLGIFESKFADSSHSMVKIAILEALRKIKSNKSAELYLRALQEDDATLAALGAVGLARDSLKNKIYVDKILTAYQRLPVTVDAEIHQMMFTALAKFKSQAVIPLLTEAMQSSDQAIAVAAKSTLEQITGEPQEMPEVAVRVNQDKYEYPTDALSGSRAIILTERGKIEIELLPEAAPLTVKNFIDLVARGFYDGLKFHRVVPNFVIQAGDPRGDGWGTPGYAIRSEFNKLNYLRGHVGMASAGKDTEGSQFFITHSPQPHLDGRYTIFGAVVAGMDVVDLIQEDDIIKKVEIKKNLASSFN